MVRLLYIKIAMLVLLPQLQAYAQAVDSKQTSQAQPSPKILEISESVSLYLAGLAVRREVDAPSGARITGRSKPVFSLHSRVSFWGPEDLDSYVVQGIQLSERLRKLVRSHISDANWFEMVALDTCCWSRYSEDGIIVEVGDQWSYPILHGSLDEIIELPSFRNGEIGIVDGEVFIKDGTEAKYDKRVYIYETGVWKSKE